MEVIQAMYLGTSTDKTWGPSKWLKRIVWKNYMHSKNKKFVERDSFLESETRRFVIGDNFPITVTIKLDEKSFEIAWFMDRLVLDEGVAAVAYRPYVDEALQTLIEPLVGHEGRVYQFFLRDSGSNGIGDGFYQIFSGTTDTSNESNAVMSGNSYTNHAEHIFIARKPGFYDRTMKNPAK
jgi:hypothetical protein